MKKIFCTLILLIITLFAYSYELETIIGAPTAGILQRGEAKIDSKLYRNNGLLLGTKIGLFPGFMFGVSFGGENVVGNKKPEWHERVEFNAKFRIIDEGPQLPAICIGFDSQGHGAWDEGLKRYDIKSKGFYAVTSRNFLFFGNLGLHLGINYSLEDKDDKDLNIFGMIDKNIGDSVILLCEYDTALNDNSDRDINKDIYGTGNGYFNLGIRILLSKDLNLTIIGYDIFENSKRTIGMDRAVKINYRMRF